MDRSPPGSSVHGILQARILEWGVMPSSRESSRPRDRTHVSYCLLHWQASSSPLAPPGKPQVRVLVAVVSCSKRSRLAQPRARDAQGRVQEGGRRPHPSGAVDSTNISRQRHDNTHRHPIRDAPRAWGPVFTGAPSPRGG